MGRRHALRSHIYVDKDGTPIFRTVKRDDEGWQQESYRDGEWKFGLSGITPVPYHLSSIHDKDELWLCEGEKDADTLVLQGKDATSLPMGTHKWRQVYAEWFQNKVVNVVQDNDDPGVAGAKKVCDELRNIGCLVRLWKPPNGFKDVTDSAGKLDLVEEDQPFWFDWSGFNHEDESWLRWPYLPSRAFVVFYGSTESSKSMVLLWLCQELSHEEKFVSFYSLENPPQVDARRLRQVQPNSKFFRLTQQALDLSKPRQVDALIERERGRDLIAIDSFGLVYPSREEGDPNESFVGFSRIVKRIIRETGATVALIDHVGYQNPEEPRGASSKRQQVDVAILMEKDGDWIGPGQPARFVMKNKKSARFTNPFYVKGIIFDTAKGGLHVEFDYEPSFPGKSDDR